MDAKQINKQLSAHYFQGEVQTVNGRNSMSAKKGSQIRPISGFIIDSYVIAETLANLVSRPDVVAQTEGLNPVNIINNYL